MMYNLRVKNSYKRDLKKIKQRNLDRNKLDSVVQLLQNGIALPDEFNDHKLTGNWKGHRECHIEPDWLLVYKIEKDELVLVLCHTGTHSDIF